MPTRLAVLLSKDMCLAYACVILAGLIQYFSAGYPDHGWEMGGPPAFLPQVLAVLLVLFAAIVAVEAFRAGTEPLRLDMTIGARMAAAAGIFLAATFMLPLLGFHVTATATAFAVIVLLTPPQDRNAAAFAAALAVAVGAAIVLHIIFARLAGVRLPSGSLMPW